MQEGDGSELAQRKTQIGTPLLSLFESQPQCKSLKQKG
jgi:hypothetical protein